MDNTNIENLLSKLVDITDNLNIPEINDTVNFWLIRSESGILYEEFITNNFVALGWNSILLDDILNADTKTKKDHLLEKISSLYDTNKPGGIFNKCDKFINHIKTGDYLMIPGKSNKTITFAIAGEYYENTEIEGNEAELKALKETGWSEVFGKEMPCPFFKRRRINVIKTLQGNVIHPNLFKALISYHGLSNINDYANEILSSIYPIYLLHDKMNMVFDVKTTKPIDAEVFSSFIYNSSNIIKSNNDNNIVTVKSNVNSPGKIILDFILSGKDFILSNKVSLIIIWVSLSGGKIGNIEINSFLKTIDDLLNSNSKRKKESAETESINIQNEKERIVLDSIKNIDKDKLFELLNIQEELQIDSNEISNIINVDFTNKKNGDN